MCQNLHIYSPSLCSLQEFGLCSANQDSNLHQDGILPLNYAKFIKHYYFAVTSISYRTCQSASFLFHKAYKSRPQSDEIISGPTCYESLRLTVISMWTSCCELLSARLVGIFRERCSNYIEFDCMQSGLSVYLILMKSQRPQIPALTRFTPLCTSTYLCPYVWPRYNGELTKWTGCGSDLWI